MFSQYDLFTQLVDSCDDVEELKAYRAENRAVVLRNEFWKQREIALTSEDPVEKERALTKAHWLQQYFGATVPVSARINKFAAPHGLYGIFISTRASVGKNCVIYQQVTIGSNTLPDSRNAGFPLIGDNVYIGAGAKIIGNVTIGDNARIGANCCVTVDVPANALVVGEKARVIPRTKPNDNTFYTPEKFVEIRFKTVFDYLNNDGSELSVEKASAEELDAVFQLYRDRVTVLRWNRNPQWRNYLLHHPKEDFLQYIEAGEVYAVKNGPLVIGAFRLSSDSENWQDDDPSAVYLSRVVVKPGYRNLGAYIVEQARRIAKKDRKRLLRLECVFGNRKLNELWKGYGFQFIRDVETRYHYALYEMQL